VRQALFWLQRDGYVDVHFKSGWQIKSFDFKYFEDLYEVRTLLETSAVACLVDAPLMSLQSLREIWCVPQAQRETEPAVVAALDEAFHTGLVAATGNQEMARIHLDITERIRIIRRLDVIKLPRVSATYDDHAAILEAIAAGEGARAQARLRAHIADSRAEVKRITFYMLQTARERYGTLPQTA
jgi:DNA-binding GntR family transcriptional regulator